MPEVTELQQEALRERYGLAAGSIAETESWQSIMRLEATLGVPVESIVNWLAGRPVPPRLWDVKAIIGEATSEHWVSAVSAEEAVLAVEAQRWPLDDLQGVERVGFHQLSTPRGNYIVTEGGLQ